MINQYNIATYLIESLLYSQQKYVTLWITMKALAVDLTHFNVINSKAYSLVDWKDIKKYLPL